MATQRPARSIRTRILAAFALSLIALAGALGYGIAQLRAIGRDIDAVNAGFLPLAEVGVELTAIVRQLDRDHDRFAREPDGPQTGRRSNAALYRAAIHDTVHQGRLAAARARSVLTRTEDLGSIDRVVDTLDEIENQSTAYEQAVSTWLAATNPAEATPLLVDLDRRRQALAAGASLSAALVEGQVQRVSHRASLAQDRALVISGALAALALLLSSILTGVALVALRPIGQLIGQVQRVAAGDYTGRIDIESADEMGVLATEFNAMAMAVADREELADRLARSERLAVVGQMLAQVTHEVRNPLNAMSLNAELLSEELPSGEATAMLDTITGEIRRLEQVTARYLDLSSRRTPEMVADDPVALVRRVLDVEDEVLRRAGVELSLNAPTGHKVQLDGDALTRALRNLVRNAIEADATTLQVSVEQADNTVRLIIEDNGPGMAPDAVKQAFEPFYTTKAKGTGLGLAISRQELEDVGGSLQCSSTPGEGTRFELIVPTESIA